MSVIIEAAVAGPMPISFSYLNVKSLAMGLDHGMKKRSFMDILTRIRRVFLVFEGKTKLREFRQVHPSSLLLELHDFSAQSRLSVMV